MLTPAVLGAAGFLQDLGSREGDFISLEVHGAICSMQPCPQPLLCRPLAWAHRTDPGWGHVLWAQLRVAVLRSACPLGFVVGLKQRLGWHFRAGLTHMAAAWQEDGSRAGAQLPRSQAQTELCQEPQCGTHSGPKPPWCQSSQGGAWIWSQWSVPAANHTELCGWWFLGRKSPRKGERCC